MKLITWNVAGRTGVIAQQLAAIERQEPDLVCLQEVRPSTAGRWAASLRSIGLDHVADSGEHRDGRRIFNLTASRWELLGLAPVGAPQPERVLSTLVDAPFGLVELHNAHVPPAQSQGLAKVETCEALLGALARPAAPAATAAGERHRILCGDLNTPKLETSEGDVITFAEHHPELIERWDAAERGLLRGLSEWGLEDAFRRLHGYERRDVSWVFHTRSMRRSGHRLDHVLASPSLRPVWCDYHHGWREQGLSDHSGLEAIFAVGAHP